MHLPGFLLAINQRNLAEAQLFKAEQNSASQAPLMQPLKVGILLQLQRHRLIANDVADRQTATRRSDAPDFLKQLAAPNGCANSKRSCSAPHRAAIGEQGLSIKILS